MRQVVSLLLLAHQFSVVRPERDVQVAESKHHKDGPDHSRLRTPTVRMIRQSRIHTATTKNRRCTRQQIYTAKEQKSGWNKTAYLPVSGAAAGVEDAQRRGANIDLGKLMRQKVSASVRGKQGNTTQKEAANAY
jgi:hypothetical protein